MEAAANSSLSTPLKLGVIVGLLYCVLIFLQNQYFYYNPLLFVLTKSLCYLIIVFGFFYTGYLRKKELGGFITFKECLKTILIVIVIAELFYFIFGFIYVKYINPAFFDNMKSAWLDFFVKNKVPEDKIKETMKSFDDRKDMDVKNMVQSFGFSVIIDAIFGVIISAILKKQKPLFENQIGT